MDFSKLWQEYKELILVIATAAATLVATLLGQKILPGLWKALAKLWGGVITRLGKHLSAGKFEQRYLEWLCEEQKFLRVRGIRTRSPVSVKLEEVYVSLTLNKPSRGEVDVQMGMETLIMEDLADGRRLTKDLRLHERAEKSERLSIGQALQNCPKRLVLLGGPGSGKTTLLSYLVLKFARGEAKQALGLDEKRLPILIALRELSRTKLPLEAENLPALCVAPEIARECPVDFFKKHLQDGNCMVLLDGMDEVTSEEERRRMAEQIEDFVATYNGNRFVVTSRPAGYSSVALSGFTQLEICDFCDEDVEAFAGDWCLAVELAVSQVESNISEAVAHRKASREAEELVAAIRASERVRRLTVNPLLLTIVAMVHRYRATLPKRRVELYDECTEVLLGYWDEAKGIAGQLDWKRKRRVMEPLAHWMHQQGWREAGRVRVEEVIAKALPSVGERETEASEFLENIRDRSGLLMERGLGMYGFSHLTFQEYLTASHLIDRGKDGLDELMKHLHDYWWLEVTLLYASIQDATPLLEAIFSQRDDLFKNNLYLAAQCLVDVVNIDTRVQEQVLSRLLEEFRAGEFEGLRERAVEALFELGNSPSALKVVEGLVVLLADIDETVRWRAAYALVELGKAEPKVLEILLKYLSDVDIIVHMKATNALVKLGKAKPAVVEALVRLVEVKDATVRGSAAEALGELGKAKPGVVDALVGLLDDVNPSVRGRAAYALGELGTAELQVVEGLVGLLDDTDDTVRWRIIIALGRLGKAEPRVVEALLELLDDANGIVRSCAVYALGEAGKAEPRVVDALVRLVEDKDASVRENTANALGELGKAEPRVVDALVRLLVDMDAMVRKSAAEALGDLGKAEPRVVEALVRLLDDMDAMVRKSAAEALGELGKAEPRVVEALAGLLGDADGTVRENAAYALGKSGKAEPRAVEALVELLGDADETLRGSAAIALGKLGNAEPQVVEALVRQLDDADESVCRSAAYALERLGKAEPRVVEILLQRLGDANLEIIKAFDKLRDRCEVVSSLITAISSPDQAVRSTAAYILDPFESLTYDYQTETALASQHVSPLCKLLNSDVEIDYSIVFPYLGKRRKVKDVAWELLRIYSERSGERIYWNDGGV